jgi:hypothetical protein
MHQTRDFFIRGDPNCRSAPLESKTSLLHLPRMQDSKRAWNFVFLHFFNPFGVSLTISVAEVWVCNGLSDSELMQLKDWINIT